MTVETVLTMAGVEYSNLPIYCVCLRRFSEFEPTVLGSGFQSMGAARDLGKPRDLGRPFCVVRLPLRRPCFLPSPSW